MSQKASKRRVRNRDKVNQALELRKAGASYSAIAEAMGMSKTRCYNLVCEGLADLEATVKEAAEELRRMELERLDALQLALWKGRTNPRVADSLLRIQERRARLLGLDAPQKIAPTTPDGTEALPTEVRVVLVKPENGNA